MKKLVVCVVLLAISIFAFGCGKCQHEYVEETVLATCEVDGYNRMVCNKCGDIQNQEVLNKKGHIYSEFIKIPTCVEDGTEISVCQNCDDVKINKTLEAIGHDYVLTELITEKTDIDNCGKYVCAVCQEEKTDVVTAESVGMPILSFNGDISEMTKEKKVTVSVSYDDGGDTVECDATLKWQGASSIAYPKKNYTMQLLKKGTTDKNKVVLNEDWGKQSKYCLKANYVDFSHARNVVSGRIYNEIVKSRDLEDEVSKLNNGGVVDGFPILIYINGEYQGLYTLNIPKDKWMAGMDDDEEGDDVVTKQALLMGETWNDYVGLQKTVDGNFSSCGFELEYCSTEDTIGDEWVYDSFNDMIEFINNNDGEDFKNGISNYVNVDRTIDSMLYTWIIMAADNVSKNILWFTYDGVHWNSSMYDMDGVWGMTWSGLEYYNASTVSKENYIDWSNVLWNKIYKNFKSDVIERYFELRTSVLSKERVKEHFVLFNESISPLAFIAEKQKWTGIPSKETSNVNQIIEFMEERFTALDSYLLTQLN